MIHAVIVANNRPDYLHQVLAALDAHHPTLPHTLVDDTNHIGMAKNVQAAWDAFLDTDAQYLLHIEDDMELLKPLPLWGAISALQQDPHLAQMCFRREPWWGSPAEMAHGDQLTAICEQATTVQDRGAYTAHDFLFSLNPCLIPRDIVEMGWPAGPLGVGNEAGMTTKLRTLGYMFGSWGHPGDGNVWARHIGEQRGEQWAL